MNSSLSFIVSLLLSEIEYVLDCFYTMAQLIPDKAIWLQRQSNWAWTQMLTRIPGTIYMGRTFSRRVQPPSDLFQDTTILTSPWITV